MKKRIKRVVLIVLSLLLVFSQLPLAYASTAASQENEGSAYAAKTSGSEELQQEGNESVSSTEKLPEGIVPGKVMVKYKSNISPEAKSSLTASVSAVAEKSVKKLGITELELSEDADVQAVVDKLNADSNVEFAEPVYVRKLTSAMPAPTVVESVYCQDEFYYKGWQWGLQAASMDELWGEADEEAQADIVIAVIDTGVDGDHPEFSGRLVDGYDFVNNDSDPDDDYGHGTHVAGIAAAANDGNGMGGVASGAMIMPVKILDSNGYGDTISEINGIVYAVNNGADVINLSLGGDYSYGEKLAIEYAIEHGVVVVAAAGNDGYWNSDYPAQLDGVISVGAADWNGSEFEMADFSNYGSSIDIVAPGVDILSTIPEELDNLNSSVGDAEEDGYALMSGTSMATPFVAGTAALLLAKGEGIDMDSEDSSVCEQILQLMQEDGIDFSDTDVYNDSYDYKLLNGSNGDYDTPFLFKKLQLSAEEATESNKVDLYLTAGDYRNGSINTLNGTFEIKRIPATRNEEGYYEIGSPESAGTIELADGEGTATVDVDGDHDYIFFAEGDDEYMDSDMAVPQDNDNSFDTAKELQIGVLEYGVISTIGDADYYCFTTPAGDAAKNYLVESTGSLDTEGYLYADDKTTELGYSDDYDNRNFGIIYELEPATTYYVKVIGYGGTSTGFYGIHVEEYTETVQEAVTITGTLSLPAGRNIADSLTGRIFLLEGEFSSTEGYDFYSGDSADFTISNGGTVNYSLQGGAGINHVVAYIISSGTDMADFVKAAYYSPTGMVVDIGSSWVFTESQTANIQLLERTAAEAQGAAYNTIAAAKELQLAESITASMDYPGDVDYYKFSIEEADNYIVKFLNSIDKLSQFDCDLEMYDALGNEIDFTSQDIMFVDDENVGVAGGASLEAGEYYLRIESKDDEIQDCYDLGFEPLEIPISINKAAEISCTVELPVGTTEYDGSFYLTDSSGMKHLTYRSLTTAKNSISFRVPVSADESYTLGYRRESSTQYDDMGYYSGSQGGITVADIKDATPISAAGDTALSIKLTITEDSANNSMESALLLPDSGIYTGTINNKLDADYFKLHAAADGTYVINYRRMQNLQRNAKDKLVETYIIAILRYEDSKWVEYAEGEEGSLAIELEAGDHYFKVIGNITNQYEDSWFVGTYELGLQSVPVATNVRVSGTAKSGNTLTGSYTYTDAQRDTEVGSSYRWLRSASADGAYTAISGETGKTYRLTSNDVGKYIKFEVTPVSDTEPSTGAAVLSSAVGPVAQADSSNNNHHHHNSGSGSGTGTAPGTTTSQETPSGNAVITTGANGSTATVVQVDSSKLAAALGTPGTNPVSIDARTATNTNNTDVVLPGGVLREAEKLQKPLIVQTNNASFEIQPGTINLGDTDQNLRLEVQELTLDAVPEAERNMAAADEVSMVFDFGMYLGSQRITDFNKPITITVRYDPSKVTDTSKLGVYYYNEKDGRWEYVGGKVNSDGTITFTVEHFSKYAVMEFTNSFEDIKTHWAKQSIELILARQITNGVDQKSFAPDRKINRAEFAVMLARALKLEKTSDKSFADVAGNAWYKGYLQKAYEAGIISGDSFAPGSPITREQMAEMLVRAYSYSSGTKLEDMRTTQQIRFKDESLSLGTSRESIILADALGLMKGNPDGTFAPKGNATRAEAAVTIIRLLEKLGKL